MIAHAQLRGFAGSSKRSARLAIVALLALCLPGIARAAQPRDYAYVFLQGRLADPYAKHPMAGATVRLTTGTRVFEAVTDRKGLFVITTYWPDPGRWEADFKTRRRR